MFTEGPKNYSYKIISPDGECLAVIVKVRGFTLNYNASLQLNFENMKSFVKREHSEPISITEAKKIQRKRHYTVISKPLTKQYKEIPSKRRLIDNYKTLPFGWVDNV